jgi:tetratricopeptide (TPR) repeat protein
LLGNAYFASGRFASAEVAYRDALLLYPDQPQAVLKLALVQIAQGKNAQALSYLSQVRSLLQPADFGLAVALAGQPQEAVNVLDAAAREVGADARVRQNLALAHALSGDWTAARNVASQDLSGDMVDARIQQWMTFAKPRAASDQVAALTGFKPVADPGQPTRLALRSSNTRTATVTLPPPAPMAPQVPVVAFAPQAEAQPVAQYVPAPEVSNQPVVQYVPEYQAPAEQAAAPQTAEPAPAPEPAAVAEVRAPAPEPPSVSTIVAAAVEAVAEAPAAFAEYVGLAPKAEPKKKVTPARALLRRASLANGNSTAVVQLGAYGSPARVAIAWNDAARRYSALRRFSPVSAKFQSPKGMVYRLSVKGFGTAQQAKSLCQSLRRAGGECFVRSVAGDAPVRLASR